MDLRRLTCFLAVADELNFSRAAQRLHMSQPPLSQQIRLLEQEMGAQLFERSRRAVTLTPAGLLLQEKARQIVELHQQAGELCRMAAHGLAGRLRIAFTASVPLFDAFSAMLRDFRTRYPEVELDLQHMTTGEQIAALTAGQIDIGFMRPSPAFRIPVPIREQTLWRDELMLALPARQAADSQPVALSALADQPFVLHPSVLGGGLHEHILALCSEAGFVPRIAQPARETSTMLALVAAGLGLSIVPSVYERICPPGVVLQPLADAARHSRIAMVSMQQAPSPCVQMFWQLLR
ncbi:LysR family transcriptional regulator [Comamonas suwonensis]|uniref:LysR family transcriptional regulator n=1 Tax=Comamonas suwonensis TaxID=2606214 RepID=UPI00145E51EE|nr:LysR family transcriptional regulator [Comamonas suwonensis]MBI1622973.1 LysR family transcriptional regulator [Comamonas suwonensis]